MAYITHINGINGYFYGMYSFEDPELLNWLFIILPLSTLFIFVMRQKEKRVAYWGLQNGMQKMIANLSLTKFKLKNIVVLIGLAFLVIATGNLRKPTELNGQHSEGIDILFLLDISNSMSGEDEKPTRLEKSKECMYKIMENLNGNRVGLILFAGSAYLQMPLTSDFSASTMYISNASPEIASLQGTDIGSALRMAQNSFPKGEIKHKAVVIFSDGEDHEGGINGPLSEIVKSGCKVFTVSLGSPGGATLTDPQTHLYKRDNKGLPITSIPNTKLLEDIAKGSNGNYYHLSDPTETAVKLCNELGKIEKKSIVEPNNAESYFSIYPVFLGFAICILILEILITENKK